jgi:hypothetical protein
LHLRLCLAGVHFHYEPRLGGYRRQHDSANRITSQNFVATDPQSALVRVCSRREMIEQSMGTPMPQSTSDVLARQLWRHGRAVLRAGHTEDARVYFKKAQSWSPGQCIVGHSLYRFAVRIGGPVIAEHLSSLRPQHFTEADLTKHVRTLFRAYF